MSTQNKQNDFGRFDFVGSAWIFGGLSLLGGIAAAIYLAVAGISYGIDFRGGTELQVKFAQHVDIDQVRTAVSRLGMGDVGVQAFEDNEYVIRFQGKTGKDDKETNDLLNESIEKLQSTIKTEFKDAGPDIRRIDTVGPQVGAELKRNGLLAVFYSLLIILIYVSLRFDYIYSPGAVICLAHDALVTLAVFVAVGKEVNIPILAAILTLIGYSLNDTIVVFDRIRETCELYKDRGWPFIINRAINDMLSRTIITSGTTFMSAIALVIFANGTTVGDIAFALCLGIVFGTYSSIYVAAPFLLVMQKIMGAKAAA